MGELDVTTGAEGVSLMVTTIVPTGLVQPLTVAVTEYIPAFIDVTDEIDGFCKALVKLLGPVQA